MNHAYSTRFWPILVISILFQIRLPSKSKIGNGRTWCGVKKIHRQVGASALRYPDFDQATCSLRRFSVSRVTRSKFVARMISPNTTSIPLQILVRKTAGMCHKVNISNSNSGKDLLFNSTTLIPFLLCLLLTQLCSNLYLWLSFLVEASCYDTLIVKVKMDYQEQYISWFVSFTYVLRTVVPSPWVLIWIALSEMCQK